MRGRVVLMGWTATGTIADFVTFCDKKNISIETSAHVNSETNEVVTENPNLNADIAIYVLSGRPKTTFRGLTHK